MKVAKNFNLFAVTGSVEAGYETIDEISVEARRRLDLSDDKKERRQLKTLIMNVSSLKPLSANGYFDISRETLTSMTSVRLNISHISLDIIFCFSVTYLIILVQFQLSSSSSTTSSSGNSTSLYEYEDLFL